MNFRHFRFGCRGRFLAEKVFPKEISKPSACVKTFNSKVKCVCGQLTRLILGNKKLPRKKFK